MKNKKTASLIATIIIVFIGLTIWELNKKKPTDWTPNFINTNKDPYGSFILFDLLKDIFPDSNIEVSRLPIYNQLSHISNDEDIEEYDETSEQENEIEEGHQSYIFINSSFEIDKLDTQTLLRFVEEGNNVFIASESFEDYFLDTLGIELRNKWNIDTLYRFNDSHTPKTFSFSPINIQQYFEQNDSTEVDFTSLVENQDQQAVFVKIKHGDGYIYLNSLPGAFSNVNLINLDKYDFAFRCLSYLPQNNNIIWDEYQKQGLLDEDNIFRVIRKHPALLFAYYILIAAGILFLLFRTKRNQRIIPVVKPPQNTSLEFLDTLSNLYYQKNAQKSIIEKRHSYLLEKIRVRYLLKTEIIDDEFIDNLNEKSLVNKDIIMSIFKLHKQVLNSNYMDNNLFLQYNEKLEEFYREMK